ncbi:MAG: BamA/TamA family outer membrane protein [Synechococcales bacterium]|nr:BamA/TamA family outer membrane protein [Synechococcales bacterium]
MRLSKVAACALSAVSAYEIGQLPAQANPNPALPTQPGDVIILTETETDPVELPASQAIAPPERIVKPGSLSPTPLPAASLPQSAASLSPSTAGMAKSIGVPAANSQVRPSPVPKGAVPSAVTKPAASKPTASKPTASKPTVSKPIAKPTPQPSNKPLPADLAVMVTEVRIVGAQEELQTIIRDQIQTQPGGQTTVNQIQQDVSTILATELFTSATSNIKNTNNGIEVTFQVEPVIVRSIELVNATAITPEVVNRIFTAQIGQPIQPSALNQGVRQVNQWYGENGYGAARAIGVEPSQDGKMRLLVAEGTVSTIKIRFIDEFGRTVDDQGNPITGRTQEAFIRREIQLAQGQPFQAKTAQADLNRLVKTGLFLGGRVTLEGDPGNAIVVYNLAERPLRQTNFGGGYSSDTGLYGNILYQDFNFNGVGQQLSGNVLIGTQDTQFDARFANPYRESNPNAWGYSVNGFRNRGLSRVFDDEIKLANDDRVREGRFGGGVSLNRPLGQDWNGSVGVNYTRVSTRDRDGDLVKRDGAGNPLTFSGTGIDDLYTVGFTATQDKRDNPFDPKSGSLLKLSTEQFVPIGVGNVFANRLQANYTQYLPVNVLNQKKTKSADQQEVLAFNLQGGTTIGDLPPHQAFTLGGANSVRGYDTNRVGIGRSYVLASAEYRFPIWQAVGGTLFVDYGTDLGSSTAVLGEPGIQRGRDGDGLGYGAGVRVKSPLGILRADWGFNDRGENRIQFGIGQKF